MTSEMDRALQDCDLPRVAAILRRLSDHPDVVSLARTLEGDAGVGVRAELIRLKRGRPLGKAAATRVTDDQIVAARRSGKPHKVTAPELGMSVSTLKRRLKELGLVRNERISDTQRPSTPAQVRE